MSDDLVTVLKYLTLYPSIGLDLIGISLPRFIHKLTSNLQLDLAPLIYGTKVNVKAQ